ncbi:MAG: HAD hydrolase family protein [Pseudomonadota bacterium]
MTQHKDAKAAAKELKLMAFDVDGVMTDGSLYYSDNGVESKAFNTLDGHGIKLLLQAGIEVAIITGRRSKCLALRAENLGIHHLFQGIEHKLETMRQLLAQLGIDAAHAGYMGDDTVDLELMQALGFAASTADGHPDVAPHAHFISTRGGGRGAVREVCDFILRAQDKYPTRQVKPASAAHSAAH